LRTAISSSSPMFFMNRTKVNNAPPRKAWERTSRQMYRVKMRTLQSRAFCGETGTGEGKTYLRGY
jgi:hypothetical protein